MRTDFVQLWVYLSATPLFGLTATLTLYVLAQMASQRLGQPNDVQKRDVPLSALDAPEVTPRETALEREVFLGPSAASAKLGKVLTEEDPGVGGRSHSSRK